MLKLIVAMDECRGIGSGNKLPWTIKEDMQEFKRITTGHGVLMGRKTLESIGKALPNRHNYVVTAQDALPYENITLVHDLRAFLREKQSSDDVVYVIGGASLYRLALDYADELIISEVKGQYPCDTFFPEFDPNDYRLRSSVDFEFFTQRWYARKHR